MTDEQKYAELLKEIGEMIAQKNIFISTQDYKIESLQRKLEVAEMKIEQSRKESNGEHTNN